MQIISLRTGSTTIAHVKAHERDTNSSRNSSIPLTLIQRHQDCNKVADKLAKSSLSLADSALAVPVETRFLSPVNVVLPQTVVPSTLGTIFENKPLKLYLRGYVAEYTLDSHLRRQWYTHLYVPTLWQSPVLASLASQKNSQSTKFLIKSSDAHFPLFIDFTSFALAYMWTRLVSFALLVVPNPSSTSSRFQCLFFGEHRGTLLRDLITLCRSRPSLGAISRSTISAMLAASLLSPPPDCQRDFSAGQLPLSLYHWLSAHLPTPTATLRLGKAIHNLLITSYQTFWRARGDAIKDRHLLFKDRLRAFPTVKPLHEMLEEDFIAYALNWHALHPPSVPAESPSTSPPLTRDTRHHPLSAADTPLSNAALLPSALPTSHILPHSTPGPFLPVPPLPVFNTSYAIFAGQLCTSAVTGDGNCLFRALLRANAQDDSTHSQLRHACINHILANWEDYTHALNAVHHDTPAFSIRDNEPFPTPAHYSTYFSTPGTFGTEVEAFVCAKLLQRPLLIWSAATRLPLHPIYNFSPAAPPFSQRIIHISYTGIHYDALLSLNAITSVQLTQQALDAVSQATSSLTLPVCPTATVESMTSTPRRRRLTHPTYASVSTLAGPWSRRRRLTQSTYKRVPASHATPRIPSGLRVAAPPVSSTNSVVPSHTPHHTHPPDRSPSPPPPYTTPSAPPTSFPSTTPVVPRRSLRLRSQSELHWGTTGHRTKRRRLNLSTTQS